MQQPHSVTHRKLPAELWSLLNLKSPPHIKVTSVPITPRALSYFWVGILWVALTAIEQEGSAPHGKSITLPRRGTLAAVPDPGWVAVRFSGDSAQAALPEPRARPSAPSLHLVYWGGGRNTETLSSEMSFNGVNDPFPSLSDPRRSGELCQIYTRITETNI